MPVFSGKTVSGTISQPLDQRDWLSVNLQTADDGFLYAPHHVEVPVPSAGNRLRIDPVPLAHQYTGVAVNNPPVLYDKFVLIQSGVTVGVISGGKVKPGARIPFRLWNSFDRIDELLSIVFSESGIFEIEGAEAGDVWGRYDEHAITLIVLDSAPRIIEMDITLTFSSGEIVVVNVLAGGQVLLRPQSELVEFIQFATDVIESISGREQRRALRAFPRTIIACTYIEDNKSRIDELKNTIKGNPAAKIGTAMWHLSRSAYSDVSAGSVVVNVDTSYSTFTPGGYAAIYEESTGFHEVRRISSVAANHILIENPITRHIARPDVIPYHFMRPSRGISWSDFQTYSTLDIEGLDTTPVPVAEYEFETEYKGLGVLPYDLNLFEKDSTRSAVLNSYEEFDGRSGIEVRSTKWDSSKQSVKFGVHAQTREDCWRLRELIYYLRGRQKTVWVPTLQDDFIATDDNEGKLIICETNGYGSYVFSGDSNFNHLAVYRNGEEPIYTEIVGAAETESEQVLVVDDTIPLIVKGEAKLSLLVRSRLKSDTIEIEWITPDECYCILPFISVKE